MKPLSKTIRLTDKLDDVGLVSEPVQESEGQLFIAKNVGPISKVEIGGDNERDPFVQSRTELKDEMRPEIGEGNEAQLIQNNELVTLSGGDKFVQGVVLLSGNEIIDQSSHIVEAHPMKLTAGFDGQAGGDMGFAQARIANQDNRLGFGQVGPHSKFEDALGVEVGQRRKVEIGQLFENRQLGGTDALLFTPLVTRGYFLLSQG